MTKAKEDKTLHRKHETNDVQGGLGGPAPLVNICIYNMAAVIYKIINSPKYKMCCQH